MIHASTWQASQNQRHQIYQLSKLNNIVSQVKMTGIFQKKLFISCSHQIEIIFLPAVPTEHLDRNRQPQFPMTPYTVQLYIRAHFV